MYWRRGQFILTLSKAEKAIPQLSKSHHNVGGLPSNIRFEEIVEPLADLFKDEVRNTGIKLKIPHELIWRQPFL